MLLNSYDSCFKWICSVLNPLGIENIEMWSDLNDRTIKDMEKFSAVYIGGGNTFKLLNDIKRSGFDRILTEFVKLGGVVYGGSAGAIIQGIDIMTCAHSDSNDINLIDVDGLNLVNFSIECHYEEDNHSLIKEYIQLYKHPVIALPEGTAVFVSENGLKVIGMNPAYIFDGESKTIVNPGLYIGEE